MPSFPLWSFLAQPFKSRKRTPAPQRRRKPAFESLEDRYAPATLSLLTNTPTDGVLPQATVNQPYTNANSSSIAFSVVGGSGSATFSLGYDIISNSDAGRYANIASTLPPGLTLTTVGQQAQLTGTPTAAGVYNFFVTAHDTGLDQDVREVFSLTVTNSLTLTENITPSGDLTVGTPYSQAIAVTNGGGASYTYALTAGNLPPGLTLSSAGVLSGTPAAWGLYGLTVTATDTATNMTVSRPYTVNVTSPVSFSVNSAPAGVIPFSSSNFIAIIGVPYVQPIFAGNGDQYSYTIKTTNLDETPVISANNILTVTPSSNGDLGYNTLNLEGTDSLSNKIPLDFTIFGSHQTGKDSGGSYIMPFGLSYGLPLGTVGQSYNQTVAAVGASGALSDFSLVDAKSPSTTYSINQTWNGLSFALSADNSTLTITGTPTSATTAGAAVITINVTYTTAAGSYTAQQYFNINITPNGNGLQILGPLSGGLPTAELGSSYSAALTTNGGTGPFTYTIPADSGAPSWLSVANGVLTGSPATTNDAGLYHFTIFATDTSTGVMDSRVFALNVIPPTTGPSAAPSFNINALPLASPQVPYSQTITATSGANPVTLTFKLPDGDAPSGMTIALNGAGNALQISGTTTESTDSYNYSGSVTIEVTATDTVTGNTTTQSYVLGIYYTPRQIWQAYGINNVIFSGGILGDGTGQTVAIVVSGDSPNIVSSTNPNFQASDAYQYDQLTGLNRYNQPNAPLFLKLDAYGGTNYPTFYGSADEITQDVEWVHAIAPGANILLLEAATSDEFYIAYQTIMNMTMPAGIAPASTVSTSFSTAENSYPSSVIAFQNLFATTPSRPMTFVFCAGDEGNYDASWMVQYNAGNSNVVSAGYTNLYVSDAQGTYQSELAIPGSGGGSSTYGQQQPWQTGVVTATSATMRTNPDVSFVGSTITATAIYQSFGNSTRPPTGLPWTDGDGTSLATPSWAALLAIANQGLELANQPLLNGPTTTLPKLYDLAGTDAFNPIDSFDSSSTISDAFGDYNPWAGLGSPVANLLLADLVGGQNTIAGSVTDGPAQTGVANVTVFLDADDDKTLDANEPTTLTAADGSYSFIVAPGSNYRTRIVVPTNFTQKSTNPADISFPVGSATESNVNFVLASTSPNTITGTVFLDLDATGTLTAGDPGLAGQTVFLDLNSNTTLDAGEPSAITTSAGIYTFSAVASGSYTVVLQTFAGNILTTPVSLAVTPSGGQTVSGVNFGLQPGTSILNVTPAPAPFGSNNPNVTVAFLTGLYQLILNRPADPVGLADWTAALAAGAGAADVAQGFYDSVEYQTGLIQSYYQNYLGRPGTTSEVNSWVSLMLSGATAPQVAAGFLASQEYQSMHLSAADFVQSLYQNVLGRNGAASEVATWVGVLSSGVGPLAVAQAFVGSQELNTLALASFYNAFLARQPDAAGQNAWLADLANQIQSLAEVATTILGSAEFQTRAQQTVA